MFVFPSMWLSFILQTSHIIHLSLALVLLQLIAATAHINAQPVSHLPNCTGTSITVATTRKFFCPYRTSRLERLGLGNIAKLRLIWLEKPLGSQATTAVSISGYQYTNAFFNE